MLGMFDPFSSAGDPYGDLPPSPTYGPPPATPGAGDGFDWTAFGSQLPKLFGATAGLVSAFKGQPYTAGPYGVSGGGLYPQGYFGGSQLGGGIGISTTTLMLIGGAILLFTLGRK